MTNTQNFINHIRDLIAKDNFKTAIQQLSALLKGSPLLDQAVQQSARYNNVMQQIRLGLVDFESANITQNQIRYGTLELLREIEEKEQIADIKAEVERFAVKIEKNVVKNSTITADNVHIGDTINNYYYTTIKSDSENTVSVFGNKSITILSNGDSPINIGFSIEDNKKLLNEEEALQYDRWLEQIEQDLKNYKPETALTHIESIIHSLEEKQNPNPTLLARLKYLSGCCKYESGTQNEWITDFLFAYEYEPNNKNYKEKALIARIWKGDYNIAETLANDIIKTDKFNTYAWAAKYVITDDIEVPELVLITDDGIKFKGVAGSFCKKTQNFKKLKSLFSDDITKWDKPNITYENKGYWFILANMRLGEIIDKDPVFLFNQVRPEIKNHPDLPNAIAFLSNILSHFDGTEKSKHLLTYPYLLAYGQFLLTPTRENVLLLIDRFEKLNDQDKKQFLFLTTCSLLQTQQFDEAIEFMKKQNDLKGDYHYLKAYAYLQKKCFEDAEKSAKTYFDSVEVFSDYTMGHFIFFLTSILQENSKKEKYFNNYLSQSKFPSNFLKKIAFFFAFCHICPVDEILALANEIVSMDEIRAFDDFYMMICETLQQIGQFSESNRILEKKVDFTKCTNGYDLFIVNLARMQSDSVRLLELLENRRKKKIDIIHIDFIYMELALLKLIPDFAQILDVVELGLECEPNNYDLILHKIQALAELNKTIEFKAYFQSKRSIFHKFSLNQLRYLSPFTIEANDYDIMIEILYPLALDKDNVKAREIYLSYFTMVVKNNISFKEFTKVAMDTVVEIEINKKKKFYHVKENTIKKDNFCQFLIENELSEEQKFEFARFTFENDNPCKVIKIYDPHQGLLKEIMNEIFDNLNPSSAFESFSVEGEVNFENINKVFVEKFGKSGDEIDKTHNNLIKGYQKRTNSFHELMIFNNDPLATYHELIHNEGIHILPLKLFANIGFQEDTKLILDFTTVPLFFELSKQLNLEFNKKFIVSHFLVTRYSQILSEISQVGGESMSLSITTKGVISHLITSEMSLHNIKYVEELLKWIKINCEVHLVREKLDVLLEASRKEKNREDILFHYFVDTSFLAFRDNYLLISDDNFFALNPISLLEQQKLLNSESYLIDTFEKIYEKEILEKLLAFNYVGLHLTYSKVNTELMKYLKGEANLYDKCLSNLSLVKSMNTEMLQGCIILARNIYLNVEQWERKKEETQRVFYAILEGNTINLDNFIPLFVVIDYHFALFSPEWIDSVKEDLSVALHKNYTEL